jgi:hypothetical protein
MGLSSQKLGYIQKRRVHTYLSVKCQLWPRFRVRNSTIHLIFILQVDIEKAIVNSPRITSRVTGSTV